MFFGRHYILEDSAKIVVPKQAAAAAFYIVCYFNGNNLTADDVSSFLCS